MEFLSLLYVMLSASRLSYTVLRHTKWLILFYVILSDFCLILVQFEVVIYSIGVKFVSDRNFFAIFTMQAETCRSVILSINF